MIRKEAYVSVGGYNENISFIEDQDMWTRLLEHHQLAVINHEMVKYRIHEQQGSAIYTDIKRKEISPMIRHISEHLLLKHGESEYARKYKAKIDRLLAIDDIRFAYHLLRKNEKFANYSGYKRFIERSKLKYSFKISEYGFLRFSIFQWFPIRLTYISLKALNKAIN
ncbi:hypothetical protein P4S52_08995 [Vibrio sp. SA48]